MADRNEKYRQKFTETAQKHVDEPIVAVAQFTPKGATGAAMLTMGVSGLAGSLMRKKSREDAGGLPDIGLYALTSTTLHVFDVKPKGTNVKIKKHVASFPRSSFTAARSAGTATDQLTLTLAEGDTIELESIKWGSQGFNEPFIEQLMAG